MSFRQSTGIPALDEHLGGGLLAGTLTVVVGATGIGKTQLGLQYAHARREEESRPGVIFDLSCRGDSQSHADYARRMLDWRLEIADRDQLPRLDSFFSPQCRPGDYLHLFDYHGRSARQGNLEFDAWRAWQAELSRKLSVAIGFLYGNLVRGAQRIVIDGVDPVDEPQESIQFETFEYVYQQILRKEAAWVARDLFREQYRRHAEEIAQHLYDHAQVGCLLLCTCRETMLEPLIEKPLGEGDWLAGANTVIYMGKVRSPSGAWERALYIPKHRGSYASDAIHRFETTAAGLRIIA